MSNYCNNAEEVTRNGKSYLQCKKTFQPCVCQKYCTALRKMIHTENKINCKYYEEAK